ncbi:polymorphic toxin-type HINT domain-containing protein [Saccharothrix sp. ST-888]|uniref:polymorphic toxin-type HINT domain-containing protein n=1 Tax=Saccharothrix sp. ST-888 TaxID=1427391 RepID=UPI000695CAB4|nr:polymorphic toxin-type HINT domain-containing protein [Saccharothrix sp. ST-888]
MTIGADPGAAHRSLAGSADRAGGQPLTQAGQLPIALAPGKKASQSAQQVRVDVTDRSKGEAAGVSGPVVALTDATPATDTAHSVTVSVDVKSLQGDGWSDRAQLVALPACALTTPQLDACRKRTPVASSLDPSTGVLTAEVTLPGSQAAGARKSALAAPTGRGSAAQPGFLQPAAAPSVSAAVLAAVSSPSGAMGSYSASPLSPSAAWGAGTNMGTFTYSYPIQTPASIGGSAPSVSLSYDSSSIDGKTSSTNAQASWAGEGWDYQPGFIERTYRGCDKNGIPNSGDQCWAGWNAQLNLGGHSGTLVHDDATGVWRLKGDDGSKVERLTGAANEAHGGEYWKVTTTDGTEFYFGLNHLPGGNNSDPAANSVEYEPVYSPGSGDDCYDAAKGNASWCQEGWRWNLDYVVDPHQNLITFTYQQDLNYYSRGGGQNNGTGTLTAYARSAELTQISYGQRLPEQIAANGGAKPAAKVLFTTAERCTPGGSITCTAAQRTTANQSSWPDTPLDENCAAKDTCTNYSPTFWSPLRLAKIETQVLVGTAYNTVDTWDLKYKFPDPGDGTKPSLWLSSVQHTGSNGQTAQTLPAVAFTERMLPNRVDGLVPAEPAFNRPRMQQIDTETGGRIIVNYRSTECSRVNSTMPSSEDGNTKACMPVKWYLPGSSAKDPVADWFHKYLVSSVAEQDAVTGPSLIKSTDYTYGGDAAWHRNDSELTEDKTRTWDEFRGYQTVTTTTGSAYPGEAPKTQQVSTYLRGMNGDHKADGSTRSVSASFTPYPGATAVTRIDDDWLAGTVLGTQTSDKAGGDIVSAETTVPSGDVATATRKQSKGMPDLVARYDSARSDSTSWGKKADGSWRTTTTAATTDPAHGNRAVQVDDKGDGTAATPEVCASKSYASGSNPMMLTVVARELIVTGPCGTTPNTSNTQKDTRTLFDGQPFGQAGATADPTSTQAIDSYDTDGKPVYATLTTATFDAYGRPKTSAGPDGKVTTTDLTPASGAIPTKVTLTGPMGQDWATSQTFDPGRSQPLVSTDANGRSTTRQYDGLGRLTAAWNPDNPTNQPANYTFSYSVNGLTAPSVVTSKSLNEDGSYSVKNELYDGLGRLRQTQANGANGPGTGRLIADVVYDSHGWPVKKSAPHFDNANEPNATIFVSQDSQVPAQDWITYDGQGRVTSDAFVSYGQPQWTSTTVYPGVDRTDTAPPPGGQPSSTITDARGRTTQLWQYRTAAATGSASDANLTSYSYTPAGQPDKRTDSVGNVWSYLFDLRGRQTSVTDPDSGTTTTAYDVNSRIASTTDAKGNKLSYTYDVLGRKTGMYAGDVAPANELAGWTYDTVPGAKGQLASSTRYVGGTSGSAYTQSVTSYDTMYRPLVTSTTIPASEGALKGTYTTSNQYSPILGSLIHTDFPALGGLPAEGVDYSPSNTGLLIASGGMSTLVQDVQYDPLGRAIKTTLGDFGSQVVSTQQYDWATGRVIRSFLDKQVGQTSLDQISYTYNPAGQITSVTDLQNTTATDQQCFSYDYLGRLTNAWTDTGGTTTKPTGTWTDSSGANHGAGTAVSVPGIGACTNSDGPAMSGTPSKPSVGGPAPYWQTYGYDATGNRKSLVQHDVTGDTGKDVTTSQAFGSGPNTSTSAPNTGGGTGGPHALLTSSVKSAAGTKVTSYQYDVAGNTTGITDTAGTTTLTWNGEDKLDSLAKSGQSQSTSYLYDVDGSQLIRRDPGKTTLNLGSDELTLDTSSGSMSDVRYYPSPGGLTITRVTAATGGGKLVYQASDPHGTNSVQIDTDAAETPTRRPTDPFGNPRGTQPDASTWAGDKGFVGGTKDDATGLTNLGAREYDPAHGRFINPDPLLAEFDPQQWNGYAYSDNSPVDKTDPSGLAWMCMDTCGATDRPRNGTPLSPVAQAEERNAQVTHVATTGSNGSGHGGSGGGGGHAKSKCGGFSGWLKCTAKSATHAVVKVVKEHPVIAAMVVTAVVVGAAACVIVSVGACGAVLFGAAVATTTGAEAGVASALIGAAAAATAEGAVALGGAALASLGVGGAVAAATAQKAEQAAGGVSARAAQPAAKEATAASKAARPSTDGANPPCNSFPAGTQVKLADGSTKSVDRIQLGDEVTATDPQTGTTVPRPVTATIVTPDDQEFTNLTIATTGPRAPPTDPQTITSTAHHPYWDITTQRWTNAADLKPGDQLRRPDGTTIQILAVDSYRTTPQTAYNLTVADLHTYYVLAGSTPVLVHNSGCGDVALGRGVKSGDALSSFTSPKPETEFVFDSDAGKFLAGDRERIPGGLSPHEQLAESMGADKSTVLGGTVFRDNGRLVFTENSGHYGHRWTDATRQQFQEFLNGHGIEYDYRPWG